MTQIDSQQLYRWLNWCRNQLTTSNLFRTFNKCFQNEIVYPVYCSIARLMGNGDQYDFVSSDEEILPLPHQASLIKITSNLVRFLITIISSTNFNFVAFSSSRVPRTQIDLWCSFADQQRSHNALNWKISKWWNSLTTRCLATTTSNVAVSRWQSFSFISSILSRFCSKTLFRRS